VPNDDDDDGGGDDDGKEKVWKGGLDVFGSEQAWMVGFCEQANDISVFHHAFFSSIIDKHMHFTFNNIVV